MDLIEYSAMKKSFILILGVLLGCLPAGAAEPLFYNIASFSPGREAVVARDLIDYRNRTGLDVALYSLSFHAEGRPAAAKAERLVASYRALRQELAGSGVKLGVLLQSTLGHWLNTDRAAEPWQRTVRIDGPGIRFCPLDPNLQAYIRTCVRKVAAEKPCLIMTDDDVTAFKPTAECFCPLHRAELGRRLGRTFTCAELQQIVKTHSDAAVVAAFNQLQEETVIGFARLIRAAIDSVDPTIPGAACMPGGEPWRAARTARAVAARGQEPILRICNGQYSEFRGLDFPRRVVYTQQLRRENADIPHLLDESDTFPHNLWSKSSRSFHAKLATSLFWGLTGAKLWYVNAHVNNLPLSRNYTDILATHRGYYGGLVAAVRGSRPEGVLIPLRAGSSGWTVPVFGLYGIPFRLESDLSADGLWALAGAEGVKALSDADLERLFAHRVLVDGAAARALTARGKDALLGVAALSGQGLVFKRERMGEIGLKLSPSDGVPKLVPQAGTRALTDLVFSEYPGAAEEVVAPGATFATNRLGGAAVVTAWHPNVGVFNRYSRHRQIWVGRLLDVLAGGRFVCRSGDEQDTLLQVRRAADGALLVQVVNLNYDPLEAVSLLLAVRPASAQVLAPDGAWRTIAPTAQPDGRLALPIRLGCMETATLRLTTENMK